MPYKTSYDNHILYFKKEDFVKKNWYINLSLRLQKGILSKQFLNLAYSYLQVHDSIITPEYNPAYFNENTTTKGLLDFSYTWQYTNVNNSSLSFKRGYCICFNGEKRAWLHRRYQSFKYRSRI